MGSRKRTTLLGCESRLPLIGRGRRTPLGLGGRKKLWRFVGALAFAPLAGFAPDASAQDSGYSAGAYPPGLSSSAPSFAAQGYDASGSPQGGYAPGGGGYAPGGYVSPAGYGQPGPGGPPSPGYGPVSIPSGSVYTARGGIDNNFGDQLGAPGATAFTGWVPLNMADGNALIFLDARGYVSYAQNGGGNFTLGGRYYVPELERFFGAYGAYDIDNGQRNGGTFNRVAVGLESIGSVTQFRANGYIPIGNSSKTLSSGFVGDPFFRGNNILFLSQTSTRYQYGGFDLEGGGALPLIGKYGLFGYLGGYYLTSDVNNTTGVQARFEANVNDDVQVGARLSSDHLFGTNVWATLTVRTPRGSFHDWMQRDWFVPPTARTRMDRQVERYYRSFTHVQQRTDNVLAINPIDNQPYVVLHVDPNAVPGGVGTFENPSAVFANQPQYDIVRVIASPNGATLSQNGPFTLFDNQRLLSTAVQHTFDSQRGTFLLPNFTGGPLPVLQNTAATGSVIVLANSDEVSGFTINGATATPGVFNGGISSQAGGIRDFDVNRSQFVNVANGVNVATVAGSNDYFLDNQVTGLGTGTGFAVTPAAGSSGNVIVQRNSFTNFATGVSLTAPASFDVSSNTIAGVVDGAVVAGGPGTTGSFNDNQVTGLGTTTGTGFRLTPSGGQPGSVSLLRNTFSTFNTGVALTTPSAFDVTGNTITNVVDGTIVTAGAATTGTFAGNTVTGVGYGGRTGFGLIAPAGSAATVAVTGNTITQFFGEDQNANLILDGNEDVNGDTMLTRGSGVLIAAAGGTANVTIDGNTVVNNDRGLVLTGTTGSAITAAARGNLISGRGFVQPTNRGLIDFNFTDPTSAFSVPRLGGPGVLADVSGGTLNLNLGGTAAGQGNRIENNTGAGIAVLASGGSVVTANVIGNEVFTNVDDLTALTPFSGQGMYVRTIDTAQFVNSTIDRNMFGSPNVGQSGNEGTGLEFEASGNSLLRNVLIGNEDGDNNNGNVFFNNGFNVNTPFLLNIFSVPNARDGVSLSRLGNATVDDFRITDNFVSDNARDGISISAAGALNDVTNVTIAQNTVQRSGDDGVQMFVQQSGVIDGTVTDNIIISNGQKDIFNQYSVTAGVRGFRNQIFPGGIPFLPPLFQANGDYVDLKTSDTGDGVSLQQNRFLLDAAAITGTWTGNTISDNYAFGVRSDAPTNDLVFGTAASGNRIERNGLTGVLVSGSGSATYTNNLISQNGTRLASSNKVPGGDADSAAGGVAIEALGFKDLTFDRNRIVDNIGDGVQISNRTTAQGTLDTLDFVDNTVARNSGRGFDVLNAGNATMDLTIRGTAAGQAVVAENGREGIYVVNTSSNTQTNLGQAAYVPAAANKGLDSTGGVNATPLMFLTIDNVDVTANGLRAAAGLPGGGIVLRVGTSDGGYFFTNRGGFADTRGGVVASITNNRITGNQGTSVYVESFTSTVDPAVTAGTWNGTTFTVTNYSGDPLARLDLEFVGNTIDTLGGGGGPGSFGDGVFNNTGAYYNNAEVDFKSRTNGRTAPDPNGPFTSATRRRNAERVGYRDETLDGLPENDGGFYDLRPQPFQPPAGFSNFFRYPGEGTSTFRISQSTFLGTNTLMNPDGTTTVLNASDLFFIDGLIYDDLSDANGVSYPGLGTAGELPYGWSVIQ